ncbi:MAG: glycosyltransferase family 39 protein [Burkholderiaceae bacterium]
MTEPPASARNGWRRRLAKDWPALVLGVAVAVVFSLSSPTEGDFWWFDAARHAMNSVFLHDLFTQGGWRDPVAYAKAYYDQYPGINIGFYPPFLYAVTAPVLAVFGVSHAVCQAVVACFVAGAAVGTYAIARPVTGRLTAVSLGAAVVLVPEMALWGRQMQLDVPAITLLIWGTWALARYLERPARRWLMMAALLLGFAMLTRVQTVFAWPLWLAVVFLHPAGRAQPWGGRLAATALYGVLALPALASVVYFSGVVGNLAGRMPDMPALLSWANWTWYVRQFPQQLGTLGLLLVLFGLSALVARPPTQLRAALSGRTGLVLAMGTLAWLFFTAVSNKEPRFGLPILPFLMMAAGLCIARWRRARYGAETDPANARPLFLIVPLLALGIVCEFGWSGRWADVPRVTGHREAALEAARLAPQGARVLISAHRDGNFIFDLRAEGGRPDLAVRRADKLLVKMTLMRQLGIEDRGLGEDDIRALLERERVAVVVSQTGYLGDQPSMQALQRLLDSDCCFRLVRTLPITGRRNDRDERELRVYQRR